MIGKLNKQITFKANTLVDDGQGGVTVSANTVFYTTRANVTPLKGSKALEYQKVIGKEPYMFLIRKRSDKALSINNFITYNSKDYTIHSIKDLKDDREDYLEIIAWA